MQLIQTTIAGQTVRMRYADHSDPAQATEWIDFQVTPKELQKDSPMMPEGQYLGEIHLAALQHARAVIGAETQRISELAGRNR